MEGRGVDLGVSKVYKTRPSLLLPLPPSLDKI